MGKIISLVFRAQLKDQLLDFIKELEHWAKKYHHQLNFIQDTLTPNDSIGFLKKTDLIVSFGGDGTLIGIFGQLSTIYKEGNFPPIFSVHMGTLGFITEFSLETFFENIEQALKGELEIAPIPIYEVILLRSKEYYRQDNFINDAVFSKNVISRMVSLKIFHRPLQEEKKKNKIFEVSGDGLIISGPLGSTAYSLAAGGPIVHPQVPAFLITPICPHGLIHRPFVVPDQSELLLELESANSNKNMMLTLDGQKVIELLDEDQIIVRKKISVTGQLVKNPKREYFQNIRDKFINRGIR